MRLLLVEDEEDMLYAIHKALKKEGYAIDTALDGPQALELLSVNPYDGVVLDINLPKLSGIEVLQALRKEDEQTKVLILSANSDINSRVAGLDMGANDYLVKPFHISELKARLRALLRRKFICSDTTRTFGALSLDSATHSLTWNEKPINLAQKEFAIIEYLMMHENAYISSETLIEHIWDEQADPFSNAIRVHIHTLRKKLEQQTGHQAIIQTLPSVGYRFNAQFEEETNGHQKA